MNRVQSPNNCKELYMKQVYMCKICKQVLNTTTLFTKHLLCTHRISRQQYHDNHEQVSTGVCLFCNKPTKWVQSNYRYNKYCNNTCQKKYQRVHNLSKKQCFDQQKKVMKISVC